MVKVNIKRVQQVDFVTISNRYKNRLNFIIDQAQSYLKSQIPKRSGKLARSIKILKGMHGNRWGFSIRALGYYEFLNNGTKDHYIAPKKKQALSWIEDDKRYFSKGHMVSGISARNYTRQVKEFILKKLREKGRSG